MQKRSFSLKVQDNKDSKTKLIQNVDNICIKKTEFWSCCFRQQTVQPSGEKPKYYLIKSIVLSQRIIKATWRWQRAIKRTSRWQQFWIALGDNVGQKSTGKIRFFFKRLDLPLEIALLEKGMFTRADFDRFVQVFSKFDVWSVFLQEKQCPISALGCCYRFWGKTSVARLDQSSSLSSKHELTPFHYAWRGTVFSYWGR